MNRLLTLLLSVLTTLTALAQESGALQLSGTVHDESRQPLQGTVVTALSSDSVRLAAAVTDSAGGFAMSFPKQNARLVISLVGYDTRYITVTKDNKKPLNIILKPASNMIGEVVVKGKNMVRKEDKLMIYLPEQNKKNAYDGYSALQSINVTGLKVNMFDETVTTHGQSTVLCINGRAVGADEISTLNPADIKRIDYYQEEDMRHPGAGPVIDFIMINRDHGGSVFAKANHNLNIGKGNATVDVKQYIGKSEIGAQVSGNYSRFTPDRGRESTTIMPLTDESITKNVYALPSSQCNNSTSGKLSFLRQWKVEDRSDMFQAAAYIKKGHSINDSRMSEEYNGAATTSYDKKHRDNISPVVQMYYESSTKNSTFRAKLNSSYNNIEQSRDYNSLIGYNSYTDQDFYSIMPSVDYMHKINERHIPAISLMYEYNDIKTRFTDNDQLKNTRMRYGYGYVWLVDNFRIIPKKLHVTFQLAGRMETTDNGNDSKTRFFFTPSVFYRVFLPKGHNINGHVSFGTAHPSESQYNDMETTVDKFQRLRGNPYLKTPKVTTGLIQYSYDRKWGGLEIETEYEQQTDHVYLNTRLDPARNLYVKTYQNGNSYRKFRFSPNIILNMFDGKLSCMSGVDYYYIRDDVFQVQSVDFLIFGTSLTCNLKNFTARLDFNTPGKSVYAGIKEKTPVDLSVSMTYTYRKWHFTASARNPFYKVWKESEYYYMGYATNTRSYSSFTQYKVFSIGANYRINYGKKHKFQKVDIDETEKSAILE